jgi:TolB-like protein/class 3 adenylate cyclase
VSEEGVERRLTTILAADVVGYSRLMGEDEVGTLAALKAHRKELLEPKAGQYHGRTIKLMGDGALMEFASVVNAVAFSVEVQAAMRARNAEVPEDRRIVYRIGINIGDIIVEDEDIYGDGVNIAARLEGLAEPGEICVALNVYDQVKAKLDLGFEHLGAREVKNIAEPVTVYRVLVDDKAAALVTPVIQEATKWAGRPWVVPAAVAVVLVAVVGGVFWWQPWAPNVEPASLERMAFPLPDRPSIAVLPFTNMSDDPGQDYFADGITEDLITDLSKISGLFVIARNSTFAYKGKPVKVRQVAEDMGVRYVLEGSVRRADDEVRINAQLVDATTGGHLWADRYDGTLEDVFALQDEVTQKIVSALAVTLTPDEQQRLSQAAQANPEAYDLLLRGLERFRRFTRETNVEAREYFERAVATDPDFARAHADIALTHAEDAFHGWAESPERSSQLALEKAQHALTLDNNSRVGHFALALTYLTMKRYDEALAENQRELDLDPNHAEGHAQRGLVLSYVGRPAEGLEAIRTALRLDPRHPFFYVWILGQAHFLLRQTEEAIAQFEKTIESNPDFVIGHMMLASAYAHAGRIDDAQWEAEEVLVLLPDFTLTAEREKAAYKDPAHLEYYLEGLRKAGMPE